MKVKDRFKNEIWFFVSEGMLVMREGHFGQWKQRDEQRHQVFERRESKLTCLV